MRRLFALRFDGMNRGVELPVGAPPHYTPGLSTKLASLMDRNRPWRRIVDIGILIAALAVAALTVRVLWAENAPAAAANGGQVSYSDARSMADLVKKAAGEDSGALKEDVVPDAEPVEYFTVPADIARKVNALIPFSREPAVAARPFVFAGTAEAHERALTCLALAAYYEAGDDSAGQAAVIQVILNRVRHPAYPKSVCGVVLQGSDRSTGCQFTFTCDGAMANRRPSAPALDRARANAENAMRGSVFVPVGNATHYHTDWVLPRWSAQMDKITAFHGHLFFRWRGAWGRPTAFRGSYAGTEGVLQPRFAVYERAVPEGAEAIDLAALLPGGTEAGAGGAPIVEAAVKSGAIVRADEARHIYYVYFGADEYPGSYAVAAFKICAGKSPCSVQGWRSVSAIPAVVAEGRAGSPSFSFSKSGSGAQESLWNCREIARSNPAQCLPGTAPAPSAVAAPERKDPSGAAI